MSEPKYELYHHGVKGMKWGVRRYQNSSGGLTALGRARYGAKKVGGAIKSAVGKAYAKRKAKKAAEKEIKRREKLMRTSNKKLTDAELQEKINRLDMEKRYNDLLKQSGRSHVTKGQQIVEEIFTNASKNIGTQTVAYVMGKGVNKMASKLFGEVGDIVNPKKGQKD